MKSILALGLLAGIALAQSSTSTTSSAPTSTIDLFFLGAFGMESFGTVSVVTQGPSTTLFNYQCTGAIAYHCHSGATILEGPETYQMVFPNFSGL
jgi:hypothetical protein